MKYVTTRPRFGPPKASKMDPKRPPKSIQKEVQEAFRFQVDFLLISQLDLHLVDIMKPNQTLVFF